MKTYENILYNVHKRTYTKIFLIVKNLEATQMSIHTRLNEQTVV